MVILSNAEAELFHRAEVVMANNDMVEQLDIEQVARVVDHAGGVGIFVAGFGIAGRMIVGEDNG